MKLIDNLRKHTKQFYLVASITLFILGGFIAFIGNTSRNPALIFLGFAGLAGGFMLFLSWRNVGGIRHIGKSKEVHDKDYKLPNCLCVSPDYLRFIYTAYPLGLSQKDHNDNKYYHVHEEAILGKHEVFELPDDDEKSRHYDPAEFANPVTMKANKKYFTWSASTMQKISIGLMAVVIGAEIIGLVAIP